MATKTVHVYRSDGTWTVKKEGRSGKTFSTQREAVSAAKESVKNEKAGQFVVHGPDGKFRVYGTHGMPRIQANPKKSRIAAEIKRAVGQVVLRRVQDTPKSAREHASQE